MVVDVRSSVRRLKLEAGYMRMTLNIPVNLPRNGWGKKENKSAGMAKSNSESNSGIGSKCSGVIWHGLCMGKKNQLKTCTVMKIMYGEMGEKISQSISETGTQL